MATLTLSHKEREGAKNVAIVSGGSSNGMILSVSNGLLSRKGDLEPTRHKEPRRMGALDPAMYRKELAGYKPRDRVVVLQQLTHAMEAGAEAADVPAELRDVYAALLAKADRSGSRVSLGPGAMFMLMPETDPSARSVISVNAPSGAGKSTWCANYATLYKRLWPDRDVFCVSALAEDAVLDAVPVTRLSLEKIAAEPITDITTTFGGPACVIFDDCEALPKAQLLAVNNWVSQCLVLGRHAGITVLICSHLANAGAQSRVRQLESHWIVSFMQVTPFSTLAYSLRRACGMSEKDVRELKRVPSRWCAVHCQAPPLALFETECRLLE